MCGINGIVRVGMAGEAAQEAAQQVASMNAALVHRGPDEGGVEVTPCAVVGMQRLAIVDLAQGQQPMTSACGRYTIVFNGEIYGYAALREELQRAGARFQTRSDTEVILQGWRLRGAAILDELNGIFAFAVVDHAEQLVHLARDQFGIKPLYWWQGVDGTLVFSSELTSLLACARVPRELDRSALAGLLVDRVVPDHLSLFAGVQQLPPGHLLRWQSGRSGTSSYYQMQAEPLVCAPGEALSALAERLDTVIASQLVADVPVGAFLSGGVDSSTVAAVAARQRPGLSTFTVGFDVARYDESGLAQVVARHIGSDHHEIRVPNTGYRRALLERIVQHVGQPHGDTSCIPTLAVSEFAAQHLKVVLSGDGGDEYFGGYRHMHWGAMIIRAGQRSPKHLGPAVARVLRSGEGLVPRRMQQAVRRAWRAAALLDLPADQAMRRLMALWQPEEARVLLGGAMDLPPPAGVEPRAFDGLPAEEYAMDYLARTYMTAGILSKVDRMSMAASLEVRVPLLDRRIVEFALGLPYALKVHEGQGKYLLREVGRPLLPAAVFDHPKTGFSPPMSAWFNDDFWNDLEGLCAPGGRLAQVLDQGELARSVAEARLAYAREGQLSADNAANRAWILAQLGIWLEAFKVAV